MYRFPGPVCLTLNVLPSDAMTRTLMNMPSPGPVGTGGGQRGLSEYDNQFIRDLAGQGLSLDALRLSHARHVHEHAQAVCENGRHSWAAQWQWATLERLEELIANAESPRGKASKKLKRLLEGPAKPIDLKEAVAEVLTAERALQLRGLSADDGGESMRLVGEAVMAVLKNKKNALAQAIEKAKRPGSKVSGADMSKAAGEVLGAERNKQLLGLSDDDASGPSSMELVCEALEVSHQHHLASLKGLIEKSKHAGKRVSDAEFKKSVAEVLGTERQMQLLGLSPEGVSGEGAMELISQVLEVSHKRHLASLKSLIAKAKHPGSTVTHRDIQKEVVQVLTANGNGSFWGCPILKTKNCQLSYPRQLKFSSEGRLFLRDPQLARLRSRSVQYV